MSWFCCSGSFRICGQKYTCWSFFFMVSGTTNQTKVHEYHGLSPKEVNKIEQKGMETKLDPNQSINCFLKQAIDAKLCVKNYARSSAIGAKLCVQRNAKIISEKELNMNRKFWGLCSYHFRRDKDGNYYRTRRRMCSQKNNWSADTPTTSTTS